MVQLENLPLEFQLNVVPQALLGPMLLELLLWGFVMSRGGINVFRPLVEGLCEAAENPRK